MGCGNSSATQLIYANPINLTSTGLDETAIYRNPESRE